MRQLEEARVKDLLNNWRRFSRDCPPDPAEVHYYTVCPDFRDYVKPSKGPTPYDPDDAGRVEDTFRLMFWTAPVDRQVLIQYYLRDGTVDQLARDLGMSKRRMYRMLSAAHQTFSREWYDAVKLSGT